jgi:hypothetical protein
LSDSGSDIEARWRCSRGGSETVGKREGVGVVEEIVGPSRIYVASGTICAVLGCRWYGVGGKDRILGI